VTKSAVVTGSTEPMPKAMAIEGVARHYAWGSPTAVPALLGNPPDGRPVAELWFGDHPIAPSPVVGARTTLDRIVDADAPGMLGAACVERIGRRLPFLVKILAARSALSIQVHPNLEQARAGFAAEEAAGIAVDAPHRNYRDANHKPELLCALTPFDAMCGFRPPPQIRAVLAELALPELAFLETALATSDPLRAAFTSVLTHPDPAAAIAAVSARVATVTEGALLATRLVSEDHPGDPGVLLALLLNYVRLQPGEAIYLDAGNIHAYLRGMAVEIMANSDNVLRCGLTSKHVDVAEALRIADFTALPDPRWRSTDGRFDVPVADFRLIRRAIDAPVVERHSGPHIVLCSEGHLTVNGLTIAPGGAVFVPADVPTTVDGRGVAFIAGSAVEASTTSPDSPRPR
jgi:mannose-6-phosphate isomerase